MLELKFIEVVILVSWHVSLYDELGLDISHGTRSRSVLRISGKILSLRMDKKRDFKMLGKKWDVA